MKVLINVLAAARDWVDARLPIMRAWDTHMGGYYAPKNFNFWYFFGVLSLLVLVNQILTGIWLTMSFVPSAEQAFKSVEYIMRDVEYGWILRYMHSTGASAFFAVVYLHMFRGLLYGSYRKPRELVWLFGMGIYLCLMAEGFLGYVLPWGQMSYWGAQVIVSLFEAIPFIGDALAEWVRGDYLISGITLNRFFALHVIAIPLVLVALVVLHLLALHEVGSNNPDGIEIKENKDENGIPKDGVPFHPYYTVHDLVGIVVFLFVFCAIIFFAPEMGGYFLEPPNFEQANQFKTPDHIAPVWYYGPFYSMLRAVTFNISDVLNSKFLGFVVMGGAIAILAVLPWLDRSAVKSIRYKGNFTKVMIVLFVVSFIILGVLGGKSPSANRTALAQFLTTFYFAFFICMPVWTNNRAPGLIPTLRWVMCFVFAMLFFILSFNASEANWLIRGIGGAFGVFFLVIPLLVAKDDVKPVPERLTMDGGLKWWQVIGVLLVIALLVLVPLKAAGAESAHDCGQIDCYEFVNPQMTQSMTKAQRQDLQRSSLQRGMRDFMDYCMGCHGAQFARFERVATDLGIPKDLAEQYLLQPGQKIGDLMSTAMPAPSAEEWFGAAPPDLTMVARVKKSGAAWLYTYLLTFYNDPSRPYGVNNLVFKDVGMPHVLAELQGEQECKAAFAFAANGGIKRDLVTAQPLEDPHRPCQRVVHIDGSGTLSPEAYQQRAYDLSNFLNYMANPVAEKSRRIGFLVLGFLVILLIFVLLLNREYWKDIH